VQRNASLGHPLIVSEISNKSESGSHLWPRAVRRAERRAASRGRGTRVWRLRLANWCGPVFTAARWRADWGSRRAAPSGREWRMHCTRPPPDQPLAHYPSGSSSALFSTLDALSNALSFSKLMKGIARTWNAIPDLAQGIFQSSNKKFQSWLCATGISNKIARFDVWLGSQCAYFLRFADVPFFVKWHGIKYNNLVMICVRYSRIPKVNAKYKKAIFLYANLQYCQFSFKFLNVNCVHVAWNQCHCTLFWLEASTNQRNAWLTIDDPRYKFIFQSSIKFPVPNDKLMYTFV